MGQNKSKSSDTYDIFNDPDKEKCSAKYNCIIIKDILNITDKIGKSIQS